MEVQKFYQTNTNNNIVYVVTGAEKKSDALKFVSRYKKEKYAKMALTYNVVKGKVVDGEELYVGGDLSDINGTDCMAVYRKSIKLVS